MQIIEIIVTISMVGLLILAIVGVIDSERKIQKHRDNLSKRLGIDKDDIFWGD